MDEILWLRCFNVLFLYQAMILIRYRYVSLVLSVEDRYAVTLCIPTWVEQETTHFKWNLKEGNDKNCAKNTL